MFITYEAAMENEIENAWDAWWRGLTRKGDPTRRPNLAREAFDAGFRIADTLRGAALTAAAAARPAQDAIGYRDAVDNIIRAETGCGYGNAAAATAAIVALPRPAQDWQPIETLDRDKTDDEHQVPLGWWTLEDEPEWQTIMGWWTGEEWEANGIEIAHCKILHWFRFPAPPTYLK